MDVAISNEGSTRVVTVSGRLNTTTAPQLEAVVDQAAADQSVTALVLDFSATSFISSAGLRVVLNAHKFFVKRGGLTIRGVQPAVMEVFTMTGLQRALNFVP
ncbi:MAG: STAS domain-containing protein [Propionibacteriaceae bacterium]|jgi:anti-sigma B factor antagonist|nr:STAS domain-containing protein [Propionibacteriaceae bacterium]